MTDAPFRYDDDLLSSCAQSDLALSIVSSESYGGAGGKGGQADAAATAASSCYELFRLHASHYGRNVLDKETFHDRRFQRFVSNVVFVHRHNLESSSSNEAGGMAHRVTLNQFSDRHEFELPLMVEGSSESFLTDFDSLPLLSIEHENAAEQHINNDGPIFSRIDSEHLVQSVASTLGLDGFGRRNHKTTTYVAKHGHHRFEGKVTPLPGSSSSFSPVFISSKKGQSSLYLERETDRRKHTVRKDKMEESDATIDGRDYPEDGENDFTKSLDWSTQNNPDGVPLVHSVMDQGSCGSCWAIAATGTVEANAARHRAFEAYTASDKKYTKQQLDASSDEMRQAAVADARAAEWEAFHKANLSVQELVDCDVRYDQGCTGGNPLLAFYFIHRYGLTSTKNYPYRGKQKQCEVDLVMDPIATAQSWGVLTPNHEDNMELVLRYIGPIAVGINGADPAFLGYEGGIFDSKKCGQDANHALLIVGYGEEIGRKSGKVHKYWIARNSWGKGWGEKGYVRMRRGSGKKGKRGVCGIARSPSVALGSSLLANEGRSKYKEKAEHHKKHEDSRWRETFSRCQIDANGNPVSCTSYHHFVEHLVTASVLLSTVIVITWLTAKMSKRNDERQRSDRGLVRGSIQIPTPDTTVLDPPEASTKDETTLLLAEDEGVDQATVYGSSPLR